MIHKIVVTGGAGFIASHLTDHLCFDYPTAEIVVIDRISYAARREHLDKSVATGQVRLVETSLLTSSMLRPTLRGADLVIHAAAESHVDNSYRDVTPFLRHNIEATVNLLQAAVDCNVSRFLHVSTDEVYGDCRDKDATSKTLLNPTNPYSASKAAAEMFVKCYAQSFGLPVRITRANNIYGTRQYPEKLIPKLICDALLGNVFYIHGSGNTKRSFLHVQDFCHAVSAILTKGKDNEIYNIPAMREFSVLDVIDIVADCLGKAKETFVRHGPDRPHNDSRYGMRGSKMVSLGWEPKRRLEADMAEIVDWYRDNLSLYKADFEPHVLPARTGSGKMEVSRAWRSTKATDKQPVQATS